MRKKGKSARSSFIQGLLFRNYNAKCPEKRTAYDWLSRDSVMVDKYIDDPLCGQVCTVQFYYEFLGGILEVQKQSNIEQIPKSIPVFFFSGKMDPVGGYSKIVKNLVKKYRDAGIKDISVKLYENGRHEMLNEINRREVFQDIIGWINSKIR